MTTGSVLIVGTSSGAGKTTLVTGICRWLLRSGISVAPFKAQNMSLNSYVTVHGEEIGRAQAVQALAAGVEPQALMNPVLVKPGSGARSHFIVLGHAVADMDIETFRSQKDHLLDVVVDCYRRLQARFDVVICEGAGSPAEINLRANDIVNMGFARRVDAPTLMVGDIDRGGMFASLVGTMALLSSEDQRLMRGFVVNRFRGDTAKLHPGLDMLEHLTGRPTLGVLPYAEGVAIDAEDSLDLGGAEDGAAPFGQDVLRIGVVRLPRASNLTDIDPLVAEPGVVVRYVGRPEELADCDLVIVPGSRATVDDLAWLRRRGIDAALTRRARTGLPVLGICGGYQMLGEQIDDDVESGAGTVAGLGLLPVRTTFSPHKVLTRPRRRLGDGSVVEGYEIRHGMTEPIDNDVEPYVVDRGCRGGTVAGTSWHGLFENDEFRRTYLSEVAGHCGRAFVPSPTTCFADLRQARLDKLADLVEEHLDTDALLAVIEGAATYGATVRLTLDDHGT